MSLNSNLSKLVYNLSLIFLLLDPLLCLIGNVFLNVILSSTVLSSPATNEALCSSSARSLQYLTSLLVSGLVYTYCRHQIIMNIQSGDSLKYLKGNIGLGNKRQEYLNVICIETSNDILTDIEEELK